MSNLEIASIFRQIAELLELKEENPFKVRAYYKAAQTIENLTSELSSIWQEEGIKGLSAIPGIGQRMAQKIKELLEQGTLSYLEELQKATPPGLTKLLEVPGLGPKKIILLLRELKIDNLEKLKKAAEEGKIRNLPTMGEKTEENILQGIKIVQQRKQRELLSESLPLAEKIINELRKKKEVKRSSLAGSLRRMKETIGDIDLLVASSQPEVVMTHFVNLPEVKRIIAQGRTKSSILTHQNKQVDLRVVSPVSFGTALMYFTGSKQHNIALRELAIKKGWKINEYGLFNSAGQKIAGEEEKEVFEKLGLTYIPPELRENQGEIELAKEGKLPSLIERKDLKGDLHLHSTWSDGSASIEELADCAQKLGYEYIAITDHSVSLKVGGGLSPERLQQQIKYIHELNKKYKNFHILAGSEVDIKADGSLDFEDEILAQLDLVIASIHTGFKQPAEVITERMVKAMKNKYVHIIAHPTGRLILERDPYLIQLEKLIQTAKETSTILELNSFPKRLDLKDIHLKKAKEAGVMVSLGTDAHHSFQLNSIRFGLSTARRGWLEKKNVLNTLSFQELKAKLAKLKTRR